MWTKKELQTQDPAESPSDQQAPGGRFVPDERIEVIRKVAYSPDERDSLKAELESQGFTVTVRETSVPPAEGEYYSATLFAEKRETVMVDTHAVAEERKEFVKRDRKLSLTTKVGFWTIAGLVLLGLFLMVLPLLRACRGL
jgi:hypothetical protein